MAEFGNTDGTILTLGLVGALALASGAMGSMSKAGSGVLKENGVEVHMDKKGKKWEVSGFGMLTDLPVTTTDDLFWQDARKKALDEGKRLAADADIEVHVITPKLGGARGTTRKSFGRENTTTWYDVSVPSSPGESYNVPIMEAHIRVFKTGKIETELNLKNLRFGTKSFANESDAKTYAKELATQLRIAGFKPVRIFKGAVLLGL